MKKLLVLSCVEFFLLSAAVVMSGTFYWTVRLYPKAIGATTNGEKVHCLKCTGPHIEWRQIPPGLIMSFETYEEARNFMDVGCDCP